MYGERLAYPFRYFPTKPVRYPAACSQVAIVELSSNTWAPPSGGSLSCTPVRCEYCPVRMLVRLGQQSAVVTWPLLKVTPESINSLVTHGITDPGRLGD